MAAQGRLREMFPGGNTTQGFYSFYDYIIGPEARRIFVIKGGPGVGKSTFMKKVGKEFQEQGFDIEFHWCSSDNNSLDGVVIDGKVALIDGTAPHIVDPIYPGAVDEIIHLGDHWNEELMRKHKDQVMEINRRVGRLFDIAYRSLVEAKVIHDELESYITESMMFNQVNLYSNELINEIFFKCTPSYGKPAKVRKMFGSAITPNGLVNTFASLLQDVQNLYVLQGEPGSGKSSIISRVATTANVYGLDTEQYYCPFDPKKLDCVIIPGLQTAVINSAPPLDLDLTRIASLDSVRFFNLNHCIDKKTLQQYRAEVKEAKERYEKALNRAIKYINLAKKAHDKLEEFYIPAMNFEAIEKRRQKVVARIEGYLKN
ncbi:MAG: hypothetical protein H0Z35_07040 [Thermoanaerobacteraceae bacterium]|nr:hypothetical protein [Thermoanaerobacteraceae bacterium]